MSCFSRVTSQGENLFLSLLFSGKKTNERSLEARQVIRQTSIWSSVLFSVKNPQSNNFFPAQFALGNNKFNSKRGLNLSLLEKNLQTPFKVGYASQTFFKKFKSCLKLPFLRYWKECESIEIQKKDDNKRKMFGYCMSIKP